MYPRWNLFIGGSFTALAIAAFVRGDYYFGGALLAIGIGWLASGLKERERRTSSRANDGPAASQ